MELVLIRHGEPEWVRDGASVDDPPLTALGADQARRLGEHLAELAPDDLFVSPLVRAQQTAEPLARVLGRSAATLPWLAEIATPEWAGIPADVVEKTFADGRIRPLDEQWDGLPGGESFRDFHVRVTGGLRGLLAEIGVVQTSQHPPLWSLDQPHRRVVVVAHAGTNAVILGELLGIAPVPWEWERFVLSHSSVTWLEPIEICGAYSFSLTRLSALDHLPPDLHTR